MRTFLIVVALLVVVAGIGLYQGWFDFTSRGPTDASEGKATVDQNQVPATPKTALDEVQDFGRKAADHIEAAKDAVVDKAQDLTHKAADAIAATTQEARD